ncbi:MAG TPA: hypothetical protein VMF67_03325, partial [Rhizomicrobium sp.]|nr:hypothetical protein [Rhizomicrobium sp.]
MQLLPGKDCAPDGVEHAVEILVNLVVPESHDAEAAMAQPGIAPRIMLSLVVAGVRRTVDFDHKPDRQTNEVHNIRTYRVLSAKAVSVHRVSPEPRPKDHFRIGHALPQASGVDSRGEFPVVHPGNIEQELYETSPDSSRTFSFLPHRGAGESLLAFVGLLRWLANRILKMAPDSKGEPDGQIQELFQQGTRSAG